MSRYSARRCDWWRQLGIVACILGVACGVAMGEEPSRSAGWVPADGPLMTRWAAEVRPENVHGEYPRPQMQREQWTNLNGLWDYAIAPKEEGRPESWQGKILVPFCAESALSGVMKRVGPDARLWYRRTFEHSKDDRNGRLLLHFGAVDWEATVWVDGRQVGTHRGGYDPFTIDITDALKDTPKHELVVGVWDPTDAGTQPRGKQVRNPRGIWYTPVTGIWQTVWLEWVPAVHVDSLTILPDVDAGEVRVTVHVAGNENPVDAWAKAIDGGRVVSEARGKSGTPLRLKISDAKLWSPDSPFLYDLDVGIKGGDRVSSYFGMRKIAVDKDEQGVPRLFLNGKPLFQYGPLDQGWWPDGLYTAPSDGALRYDIEVTKKLGMNMIRKHVKVEPARWYYHCDRLGVLVWQDMPNGDKHAGKGHGKGIQRSPQSARQFEREWSQIIDALRNHPSIVMWVPFNESWGQFDTPRITDMTRRLDPTRLVNSASGWSDHGTGQVNDVHRYPGPGMPGLEAERAAVLGEFGGLGLPVEGHLWRDKDNWGYRTFPSRAALTEGYLELIAKLKPLVEKGLAAAVYTQTTDVEGEVNGLMTYDRAMIKMDADKLRQAHQELYNHCTED